jgi:saccharopine dehydrogenase-like NADP-dependent oxidoreductase
VRFVVFGGGIQGEVIARNLAGRRETDRVTVADVRPAAGGRLPSKCVRSRANVLKKAEVARASRGADAAVLAVPSAIARNALENLIEAGIPTADISFTPEPPLDLSARARRAGVPVVLDCGLAPGLSHILAAAAHRELGGLDSLRIYVGGIPQRPPEFFGHAVYFNPRDLLDEYIRPARMRVGGRRLAPHPLDGEVEALKDSRVGLLDAFPSDGLRTLLGSFPRVPDMIELTLRHPIHLAMMESLRSLGLLDGDDATDALAAALGRRYPWSRFPDQVLMEVWARGGRNERRYRLHALAHRRASALARITGYTGAAVAVLLARRGFTEPGVFPPEKLGLQKEWTSSVLEDLGVHGIRIDDRGRLRTLQGTGAGRLGR